MKQFTEVIPLRAASVTATRLSCPQPVESLLFLLVVLFAGLDWRRARALSVRAPTEAE